MDLIRKNTDGHMRVNAHMCVRQYKQMEYLTFPLLEEVGMVRHLFSTRIGGVSKGIYASMNLSYSRGDPGRPIQPMCVWSRKRTAEKAWSIRRITMMWTDL